MKAPFKSKVNILGQIYTIEIKKSGEEIGFKRHPNAYGFTDCVMKRIVLCDMTERWKDASDECIITFMKQVLRHEIVHTFLGESGLWESAHHYMFAWSKNEEMVDWIAIQGPKLIKAWEEAGAL
jgi:hypothetical protein